MGAYVCEYLVPTELTEYTEAYGLKLLESTEWPTLREAGIHRNEGCISYQFCAFCRMTLSVYTLCGFEKNKPVGFCVFSEFCGNSIFRMNRF